MVTVGRSLRRTERNNITYKEVNTNKRVDSFQKNYIYLNEKNCWFTKPLNSCILSCSFYWSKHIKGVANTRSQTLKKRLV